MKIHLQILAFILVLLSIDVSCQENSSKFNYGLQTGLSLTIPRYYGLNREFVDDKNRAHYYEFGMFLTYELSKRFTIGSSSSFRKIKRSGFKTINDKILLLNNGVVNTDYWNYLFKIEAISIDFTLMYDFAQRKKYKLFFSAGYTNNFQISRNTQLEYVITETKYCTGINRTYQVVPNVRQLNFINNIYFDSIEFGMGIKLERYSSIIFLSRMYEIYGGIRFKYNL